MNKYTIMQKNQYDLDASNWSVNFRDPVVGSFDLHNSWKDYNLYLFRDLIFNPAELSCLDFACGPGRNIVNYSSFFKQFDGVDISEINLLKAKEWIKYNNIKEENISLISCNGVDLSNIESDKYDVIMSTIAFQHICVYDIRKNYLKEFNRVLKKGGYLTIQMGFGEGHPQSVGYYDNHYDADETNGSCDTRVEKVEYIQNDLNDTGFHKFNYYVTKTGPGDRHPSWIFFNCTKL